MKAKEQARQQNVMQSQAVADAQSQLSQAQTVEEYETIYKGLSPLQQSAFPTPDEIRAQQQQQRELAVGEIQTRIEEKRAGIAKEQAYIDKERSRDNPNKRANIKSSEEDIEDYNNEISKLQEGLDRIQKGENIEAGAVFDYASNYTRYRSDVREGKKRARDAQAKELKPTDEGFTFTGVVQESFKGKPQGTSYFVGGKKVSQKDFMSSYDIYLEPSKQQPVKLVVAKGTDINKLRQDEQEQREASATTYLSNFSSKVSAPPAEDKAGALTKAGRFLKTIYTLSPFGTGVKVDEETNKARETGAGRFLSLLTYGEASSALASERKRKTEAETQISLIEELNTLVEGAPEDIKPEVQAQGFKLLESRGITTIPGEDLGGEPGTVLFASEALKPSTSFDAYQIEKEDALEQRALAGEDIPGIFINKGLSQNFTVPTRSTIIQAGSYDPFSYQTSPSERVTNVRKGLLYTRIFSTKATEVYGSGKLLEVAGVALFKGGKYFYDALGGGARITELVIKSERAGVAVLESAPQRSEFVTSLIGKGRRTIVAGSLGLYATSRAGSFLLEPRTPAERKEFILKTGGEVFGIGSLLGEGAINRANAQRVNLAIQRENERRIALAEAKKLASARAVAGSRSEIGFTEVGTGRTFFNQRTLESLGGQYAKLSGLSKEDSIQKIIEASVGKQTVVVGSALDARSATVFNRYSFASTTRDGQRAKTLTFDFNLDKAGVPRNVRVKTTVAGDQFAITNVFSKARARPGKANIDEFKLDETVVSKLSDVTRVDEGAKQITRYGVEDRLVRSRPYGNDRLTGKELLEVGFENVDEAYLAKVFESATKTRKTGTFMNVRVEGQKLDDFDFVNLDNEDVLRIAQGARVGKEGEFVFLQKGIGKRSVATFNLKPEQYADLGDFDKAVARALRKKSGTVVVDDLAEAGAGKLLVTEQGTVQVNTGFPASQANVRLADLGVQVPTVSPPAVRAPVKINAVKAVENEVAVFGTQTKGALDLRIGEDQFFGLKSDLKSRSALLNAVRQALGQQQQQKQVAKSAQKTSATQRLLQLQNVLLRTPRTPKITTTRTPTPTRAPKIDLPDFDQEVFEKVRKRGKKSRQAKELQYSQDFTSRILETPVQELSAKEIEKLVKKTQTGFEARPAVVLKGSSQARATKSLRKLLNQ